MPSLFRRQRQAMYLRRLEVREFRNYEREGVDFSAGVVVLHGPNGAGKTNLMEAICVAATGTSPRTRATGELVRQGSEHGFVRGEFAREGQTARVEVGLARAGERHIKVRGVVRKQVDLIGMLPVVYFSTDDIAVVRGDPGGRRRLFDRELAAISSGYHFNLTRYRRAIQQRNRLLKDLRRKGGDAGALAPWDREAARYGAQVMVARQAFLEELAPPVAEAHAVLTRGDTPFLMAYHPSIEVSALQNGVNSQQDRGYY